MSLHLQLVAALLRLLSRLPLWWLYRLSDLLAPLVYHVVRYRRRTVRTNIDRSFPELSVMERRRIERRFYRFFCDYAVETVKLMTIGREEIMRRMKVVGAEEMDAELRHAPFVFLMLGHYGNWEWLSTIGSWSHEHCAQLYTPLHNATFDRIFLRLRSRFGSECVSKRDALRRILTLKREGIPAHFGFISDQAPTPNSIHDWMTFLHQDTPLFTGAERIGKRVGGAAWFARVERPRRGYYVCHLERITADMTAYPDYEVTEQYMRLLEAEIRRAPHLWLWTHKRWKHQRNSRGELIS